ncbi:MAG: plasmid pRiA4b ORF-3 family protein [SAR324 cluster bacterium]|nr:plasmid pRiA4b ORF-3 family protein [SAR324 cluster bacterium]
MPEYLELEISLVGIRPRIWRRFRIASTATFADLHDAIQQSFGWENCHLWEFVEPRRRGNAIAGIPDDEFRDGRPAASAVKLSQYFTGKGTGKRCHYVYDFGDDWTHDVKLVGTGSDPERYHRRLLAGKHACPPEDCGGVPGYARMVEFLATGKDPYGEDPEELREWIDDLQPESFDLAAWKAAFDR